jgi:hypothetical protein
MITVRFEHTSRASHDQAAEVAESLVAGVEATYEIHPSAKRDVPHAIFITGSFSAIDHVLDRYTDEDDDEKLAILQDRSRTMVAVTAG